MSEEKTKVSIDVGAKASFEAKISTEVPAASSGRFLDALTDLIRPLSERRGLKADQIRLQRESVAIEIVKKARERLAAEQASISPIPNKFIVPFLEKASLEEEGSELIDRWADLLARAATSYGPSMTRFATVLSEIGAGEVRFLQRIVREPRGLRPLSFIHDVPFQFIPHHLMTDIGNLDVSGKDAAAIAKEIFEKFEYPGTIWPFLGIGVDGDGELEEYANDTFDEQSDEIASNLVSLGVLNLVDGLDGEIEPNVDWYGRVYAITRFGISFVRACDRELNGDLERMEKDFNRQLKDLDEFLSQEGSQD